MPHHNHISEYSVTCPSANRRFMVSVIVPVYNSEKYLFRCLDSLLQQTYSDFELICINDGSLDNSLKILKTYASKDRRISIIDQTNQGQSIARNKAIEIAKGAYIAFVDSDDWCEADFLERLVSSAQKNDADVVQSGYIQHHTKFVQRETVCMSFADILKNLHKCFVWNKLWKTDFIKKNHLHFLPHCLYEDVAFCCFAALYAKCWNIIEYAGYNYTVNPTSSTNDQNLQLIQKRHLDKITVCSQVVNFVQKNKIHELELVKDFLIMQLLENSDLINRTTYPKLSEIFENNKLFRKKRRKALRKWLFQFSFKKRKMILFGHSFWKNDKV